MRYAYYELARAVADELGVIISRAFGSVILLDIDYNDEDNDFYGEENDESNDAEMMLLQSERR